MPSGLVSIASAAITGYFAGRQSNRWLWISLLCVPAVLGGTLMSFLPATNHEGRLAGIYLINTAVSFTLANSSSLTHGADCVDMIRLLQLWSWFIPGLQQMSLAKRSGLFSIGLPSIFYSSCGGHDFIVYFPPP
jgi:hypothetical protein